MFSDYIKALTLIFMAEMGDKTQILAMTFATQYSIRQILAGVGLGSALNHGMAIVLGTMLTRFVPLDALQLVAGVMFLVFGYLSLKVEDDEDDDDVKFKMNPIATVALAFFVGELGDKTQLTALTFSLGSAYPAFVLMGTVSGMVLTSLLGIFIGSRLGKQIPEDKLKIGASLIFMFFGIGKLSESPYMSLVPSAAVMAGGVMLLGAYLFMGRRFIISAKAQDTLLKKRAEALHQHMIRLQAGIEMLCLGEELCKHCNGSGCLVGFMRMTVANALEGHEKAKDVEFEKIGSLLNKDFSKDKSLLLLKEIISYYEEFPEEFGKSSSLESIRAALETILFDEPIEEVQDSEMYKHILQDRIDRI